MNNRNRKNKLLLLIAGVLLPVILIGVVAIALPPYLQSLDGGPEATPPGVDLQPPVKTPTEEPTPTPDTSNRVILYDQLLQAIPSPIQVQVNGKDVFVEQYKDIHYARFAFEGSVQVNVTSPGAANYTISPRSYNIQSSKQDNTLSFTINEPRKLILQSSSEKLFIFADGPEEDAPQLNDAGVIDVSKYVSDTRGTAIQTQQLQQAIDDAAVQQGIVYFPSGTYVSGTLRIKSNVSLYLSSGALLIGSGKLKDTNEHFLLFEDVQNAKLYGRGVIDARGLELRQQSDDDGRVKIIRTIRASNIEINDVLLRDAGSWTVHIVGSRNVTVTNLKLINDMSNTNGDGIDPDSSSNVTLDGTFLYTTDDCFAIKTTGNFKVLQPTSNIMIKNAVCYSKKSALKVGTETRANLSNITFENNDVVHADRVISLYMADGSTMEHILYKNNRSEVVGGDSKERLIDINITDRKGLGHIKDVVILNHIAYQPAPEPSAITGIAGHEIDVRIINFSIAGQICNSLTDAGIESEYADVTFDMEA